MLSLLLMNPSNPNAGRVSGGGEVLYILSHKEFLMARNVAMAVNGNILTISVDLSKPGTVSASGKSVVIGTTEGNVSVNDRPEIKVGLNVYTPKK